MSTIQQHIQTPAVEIITYILIIIFSLQAGYWVLLKKPMIQIHKLINIQKQYQQKQSLSYNHSVRKTINMHAIRTSIERSQLTLSNLEQKHGILHLSLNGTYTQLLRFLQSLKQSNSNLSFLRLCAYKNKKITYELSLQIPH